MASYKVPKKWKRVRKFSEKEMKNLMARLYRLFETHPDKFVFKRSENKGFIYYQAGEQKGTNIHYIVIDFRDELLATLVHECLHFLYPHHTETQIERLEWKFMKTITPKQVRNLLYKFSINVCSTAPSRRANELSRECK